MANKILDTIYNFFEIDKKNNNATENPVTETENEVREEKQIEISVVIDFVRELEAYYTNDIFKQKSDYINDVSLTDDQVKFLKKKIQEYEYAVKLIVGIKEELLQIDRGYKELWRKSSYSFYDELESAKLKDILFEAFKVVKQLAAINAIPDLDEIIRKRLVSYQKSWNLEGEDIPKNTGLRIIDKKDNIETYRFGDFQKEIIESSSYHNLLIEQLRAIRNLKIKLLFESPANNNVWIRCTTINRQQLEYLKRTTFFYNDWENVVRDEIVFDIVECNDIEYYVRAMLELLLPRKSYVIISIMNPNFEILDLLKDVIEVDSQNRKVKIIDKMAFLLPERTGYKDNLQIECVSRKQRLEEITFKSYSDFINKFI